MIVKGAKCRVLEAGEIDAQNRKSILSVSITSGLEGKEMGSVRGGPI